MIERGSEMYPNGFNPQQPDIEGVPRNLGRYYLIDVIGRGGMAMVVRGYDRERQQFVALKILQQSELELDDNGHYNDSQVELLKRFRKEVDILSVLHHPNISSAFDSGDYGEIVFLVMTLFEGGSLERYLNRTPNKRLILSHTAWIVQQLASGLNYAHRRSVVHRDIKPSNVLLNFQNQRAVLSDFGIAKLLNSSNNQLTKTGMGVGTPDYMAPEQFLGKVGILSDVYALGILTYRLLTGVLPFSGNDIFLIMDAQRSGQIPSMASHDLPQFSLLDGFFAKALAFKETDRFSSVTEFSEAFEKDCHQIAAQQIPPQTFHTNPLPFIAGVGLPPLPNSITANLPEALPNANRLGSTPAPSPTPANSFGPNAVYGRTPMPPDTSHPITPPHVLLGNNSVNSRPNSQPVVNVPTSAGAQPVPSSKNPLLLALIGAVGLVVILLLALLIVIIISLGHNQSANNAVTGTAAAASQQNEITATFSAFQTNAALAQKDVASTVTVAAETENAMISATIQALQAQLQTSSVPTSTPTP